ncbi:hypothetical protein DITRI_Ditri03aG0028900 [Diplodiscus trichospermus]
MVQLGWIAGVGTLLLFSRITYYTSSFLADCYRSPNSTSGKRNYSYMEAVKTNLGGIKYKACRFLQYTFLSGMLVGYTITSSVSMVTICKSNCFHKKSHRASRKFSNNPYMIALGVVEIFVSQISNFHQLSWLSIIAAIMSFGYAFTRMGLAFAKVVSSNGAKTTLTGVGAGVDLTIANKIWRMFTAAGNMAFACAYSSIFIEIQDCEEKVEFQLIKANLENIICGGGNSHCMALPFFNDIIALLRAIGYWLVTVYFPVEMHISQKKIKQGTIRWLSLQLLNLVCLLVALVARAGAIQGLIHALQTSKLFNFKY